MKVSSLLEVEDRLIGEDGEVFSLTTDPHRAGPGVLTVCCREDAARARELCATAREKGSVCAGVKGSGAQVETDDPRRLAAFAAAALSGHPERRLRIIGVTGTNGKTTVSSLVTHILRAAGERCAVLGTVNGEGYTTPVPELLFPRLRTLAASGVQVLVMEVSSHALAQKRVLPIDFYGSIFINLSREHLDYHKTMEAYAAAKAQLFAQSGFGVLNGDDAFSPRMAQECREAVFFSAAREVSRGEQSPDGVRFDLGGRRYFFPVPGAFSVENALAAIRFCQRYGVADETIQKALADFPGVCGRMEKVKTNAPFYVIIDYAHTPDGLEKVLSSLCALKKGRLIVVFGAGGERDRGKRPLMGAVCSRYADYMVLTSDNPRRENPYRILREVFGGMQEGETPFAVIEDRREATRFAMSRAGVGDIVLLCGKGHERVQLIGGEAIPYDERLVCREILQEGI
mgnify:FL=1